MNETDKNTDNAAIKKIIPSKLETGVQKLLYKTVGKYIPSWVTPNQVTFLGAFGGLVGIICALLAKTNKLFLIGTILGLTCHLICDDLDGYVARSRNMTSKFGGYFDLLTDILHITYLSIALSFSGYIHFEISIFIVPVYALLMFTAMNYILYFREFLFPRVGPIETHLLFAGACIGSIYFGTDNLIWKFKVADLILLVGLIPAYYETIRLQVQLFKRLKLKDMEEKEKEVKNG